MKIRPRIYRIACLLFAAGLLVLGSCGREQTTVPPDSEPLTIAPSTTDPSTPDPSTTDPSTPDPSIPDPSIPDSSTPEPSTSEPSIPESLKGTKWKIVGIVDVETGVLKELEPKDCEKCYMLTFGRDSLVFIFSTVNTGSMSFDDMNDNNIPNRLPRTKALDPLDGELYLYVHRYITSYIQEDSELKLFYQIDKKKSYLLYKLIQP